MRMPQRRCIRGVVINARN